MQTRMLTVLAGLALAACATDPRFPDPVAGDPVLARDLLERAAQRGPVPLEVVGAPADLPAQAVASLAAAGIRGRAVSFDAEHRAAHGYRLLLAFPAAPDEQARCARGEIEGESEAGRPLEGRDDTSWPASGSSRRPLTVAFCSGPEPIASVRALPAGDGVAQLERAIWQATGRLFPDPYPEAYGVDIGGYRVRIGATAAF